MALPWLTALRVIPWRAILENAPTLARSADTLLSRMATQRSPDEAGRRLDERVSVLEQRDRETAELLTRVTDQLADLTAAIEVLEARMRWLLIAVGVLGLTLVASGLSVWLR